MPQWCDTHKRHTIDETCPGCERDSQALVKAAQAHINALENLLAVYRIGNYSRDAAASDRVTKTRKAWEKVKNEA